MWKIVDALIALQKAQKDSPESAWEQEDNYELELLSCLNADKLTPIVFLELMKPPIYVDISSSDDEDDDIDEDPDEDENESVSPENNVACGIWEHTEYCECPCCNGYCDCDDPNTDTDGADDDEGTEPVEDETENI